MSLANSDWQDIQRMCSSSPGASENFAGADAEEYAYVVGIDEVALIIKPKPER